MAEFVLPSRFGSATMQFGSLLFRVWGGFAGSSKIFNGKCAKHSGKW
jgi:hypothetical protein